MITSLFLYTANMNTYIINITRKYIKEKTLIK